MLANRYFDDPTFVTNIDVVQILLKYLFSFLNFFLMISEIELFLNF